MVNLVKNAIKFSRARQIRILAGYDYKKSVLHVQVNDEGKGIRADEKERLFTLFDQVDRTKSVNIEGVGMGLNICKKIIDENEGTIEVFSEGEN